MTSCPGCHSGTGRRVVVNCPIRGAAGEVGGATLQTAWTPLAALEFGSYLRLTVQFSLLQHQSLCDCTGRGIRGPQTPGNGECAGLGVPGRRRGARWDGLADGPSRHHLQSLRTGVPQGSDLSPFRLTEWWPGRQLESGRPDTARGDFSTGPGPSLGSSAPTAPRPQTVR